ncbi:MarR family protein [Methanobrevibacter cuticularis]|uniref:MarR family protein n=1 Tax=Methanobrevibacter cuticularis TaxID=47311 RepID=A0A166E5H7_9EURY|nr:MarR family transcriptional regulator [Methanobrevibacter cuticularis]KZX16301.1 MarR family protein [Methanobrevibacter cuticularis]
MIISLIKEQSTKEYDEQMKKKYGSMEKLEKLLEKTPENTLYFDLQNWKLLLETPEEPIIKKEVIITDKISIGENEIQILNIIKNEKPKSVREIALKIKKDPANINNKINHLAKEGLISFKKGLKNSKIPTLNYDKIEIAI